MKGMAGFWLLFAVGVFFAPRMAFAYLDPGTGTMILQLLIAGFASAGVAWKLLWRKLCGVKSSVGGKSSCMSKSSCTDGQEACGSTKSAQASQDSASTSIAS